MLLIGGGVANFTNVATTFRGIIRSIRSFQEALRAHGVKIYVRRGGPNYQEGLREMQELGESINLPIYVFGPETHMTAIVGMALGLVEAPTNSSAIVTPSFYEAQNQQQPPLSRAKSTSSEAVSFSPFYSSS